MWLGVASRMDTKNACVPPKNTRLYAQSILGSIVNITKGGNSYDHLTSTRIFTLITNKITIQLHGSHIYLLSSLIAFNGTRYRTSTNFL